MPEILPRLSLSEQAEPAHDGHVPAAYLLAALALRRHAEDVLVPAAVKHLIGTLAGVVDEAVEAVLCGGWVPDVGAGVVPAAIAWRDADRAGVDVGLAPGIVIVHLAGGDDAMERAVEGAEDDDARGGADAAFVTSVDLVIGPSASGRTPYVARALAAAALRGAFAAVVTCTPGSRCARSPGSPTVADTGPEAIPGSTGLKETSALNRILNSSSTALMVRAG